MIAKIQTYNRISVLGDFGRQQVLETSPSLSLVEST